MAQGRRQVSWKAVSTTAMPTTVSRSRTRLSRPFHGGRAASSRKVRGSPPARGRITTSSRLPGMTYNDRVPRASVTPTDAQRPDRPPGQFLAGLLVLGLGVWYVDWALWITLVDQFGSVIFPFIL